MEPEGEDAEPPATELAVGDAPPESFEIAAGETATRRLLLDGNERVFWRVLVKDGYTIDLGIKVACEARRSEVNLVGRRLALKGVHNCRVLQEPERSVVFEGHLDLGGEHAGCFGDFSSGRAVLQFEFDNYFSYFASKHVELRLSKAITAAPAASSGSGVPTQPNGSGSPTSRLAPAAPAPQATAVVAALPAVSSVIAVRGGSAAQKLTETVARSLASAEAAGEWQRSLQLLGRMRSAGVAPDAGCFASAIGACKTARHWEGALSLLQDMQQTRVLPDRCCYQAAIEACERGGQPEWALRLMEDMGTAQEAHAPQARDGSAGLAADLAWLAWALNELLSRCPADAASLRHSLEEARKSLTKLAAAQH